MNSELENFAMQTYSNEIILSVNWHYAKEEIAPPTDSHDPVIQNLRQNSVPTFTGNYYATKETNEFALYKLVYITF
jgi:hypothetical protein